mgnify:FL=1
MEKQSNSFGTRMLLLYLLSAYFLPACGLFLLDFESGIYRSPALNLPELLYGLLLFAVIILLSFDRSPKWRFRIPPINPPHFLLEVGPLLGLIGVTAIGFVEGLSRWRYSATGLSENLSMSSIVYVISPSIFEILLFFEVFYVRDLPEKRLQRRIIVLLLSAGLALTASGIGPALVVAVALLYAIFPAQFRVLIFKDCSSPGVGVGAKLGVIPMVRAALASLVIAFVIGEQIKTGSDAAGVASYWGDLGFRDYAGYLLERFSTAWISLRVALADYTTTSWSEVGANLWAPIGNFLFRLDLLTGGAMGFQRPYEGSLMRVNYELITLNPINEREGTSPGLIGGFVIAFPMPFSLIALAGYTYFMRTMFNYLGAAFLGAPTWIGSCLALYFFYSLFASPIDYFLIFDNGFISFVGYMGLALFIRSRFRKAFPNARS